MADDARPFTPEEWDGMRRSLSQLLEIDDLVGSFEDSMQCYLGSFQWNVRFKRKVSSAELTASIANRMTNAGQLLVAVLSRIIAQHDAEQGSVEP